MNTKMRAWEPLGAVSPEALIDARRALHWAAQPAASVGTSLLPARPDYGHTNLEWLPEHAALAGEPVRGRRAALRPADMSLLLIDEAGATDTLALTGRTIEQALAWLGEHLGATALAWDTYELPAHPAREGGTLSASPEATAELARWFADGDRALRAVAAAHGGAPVRCWPHHFDLATLITLQGADEPARTIGVGLSPGDASYPAPYWYVTPWPYPPAHRPLPTLPAGRWHRAGWTGAVLTAADTLSVAAEAQAPLVEGFLGAAVAACRSIHGA